uniref:(northern house mosquito) hypothetical protein n=1 Tax=Culex pipiens TaxID=7175 RepID=A0A8D8F9R8_CULPI
MSNEIDSQYGADVLTGVKIPQLRESRRVCDVRAKGNVACLELFDGWRWKRPPRRMIFNTSPKIGRSPLRSPELSSEKEKGRIIFSTTSSARWWRTTTAKTTMVTQPGKEAFHRFQWFQWPRKPPPLVVMDTSYVRLRSVMSLCTTKPTYKVTPFEIKSPRSVLKPRGPT